MNIRTDLAVESGELRSAADQEGFSETKETEGGIRLSRIKITTPQAAKRIGKPEGTYITIFFDGAFSDDGLFQQAIQITARELKALLPEKGCVLAAGLGNGQMTSDALGPKTIDRLLVTRHIKQELPEIYRELALGELAAIKPGVLGQTGIESAELIHAAAEKVQPDCILVFDALASRKTERLCTTVQISDTGITPGSGVGNHRTALRKEEFGVPVIGIGIPTVIDAVTMTLDTLSEVGKAEGAQEKISPYRKNLIVTPRDIDMLINRSVVLLSTAVNKAIHGNLSQEEINALAGGCA